MTRRRLALETRRHLLLSATHARLLLVHDTGSQLLPFREARSRLLFAPSVSSSSRRRANAQVGQGFDSTAGPLVPDAEDDPGDGQMAFVFADGRANDGAPADPERHVVGRIISASAMELAASDGRSAVVFQRSQGRICHIFMP